jgi:hypothetical protein
VGGRAVLLLLVVFVLAVDGPHLVRLQRIVDRRRIRHLVGGVLWWRFEGGGAL